MDAVCSADCSSPAGRDAVAGGMQAEDAMSCGVCSLGVAAAEGAMSCGVCSLGVAAAEGGVGVGAKIRWNSFTSIVLPYSASRRWKTRASATCRARWIPIGSSSGLLFCCAGSARGDVGSPSRQRTCASCWHALSRSPDER